MKSTIVTLALTAAAAAAAELPHTVNVQGLLATATGTAVTDGSYTFTWRLYTAPDALAAAWSAVEPLVVVTDGLFSATLGDEPGVTPPPPSLFAGPLWLGIAIDAEPELPRRPIHAVPQALYSAAAGQAALALTSAGLECSGCVGPEDLAPAAIEAAHLSAGARALFVSSSGGTVAGALAVTGGVDLGGSVLTGARLAAGNVAGQDCAALDLGRVVVDGATARLYWCDGKKYLRLATCTGSCKAASAVPCGALVTDDCGDVSPGCSGKGAGCPAGQLCGASGCFNDGSSVLAAAHSCKALHDQAPTLPSGDYWVDPDGSGGLAAFQVPCDMLADGGGWTVIRFTADLPFQNHFTSGDTFKYLAADFKTVLSSVQIAAIQAVSTEGRQTYVGQCENVIHYFYTAEGGHSYAFGFRFLDGTETPSGQSSYAPFSVTVPQDGCKANGGENGSLALATLFEISSTKVPVVNVRTRDSGDAPEKFGSPLTANPARLR